MIDTEDDGVLRTFSTGATRNTSEDKLDYHKFLSPQVLRRYAEFMHAQRKQADGSVRDGDNWKKGFPMDSFVGSGTRHFMDWWLQHEGEDTGIDLEDSLCALLFNVSGYLHQTLKDRQDKE